MKEITKNRLTDRKRAAVVEAAIAEFAKNGFDHAKMDEIAKAADVSKRTVYNHFANKEALFEAILIRVREQASRAEPVAYQPKKSLKKQLSAVGWSYARLITDESLIRLCRIAISRFIHSPETGRAAIDAHDNLNRGVAEWIEAAMKDKRLKKLDVEDAATQFTAMINGFAFWPQMISPEPRLTQSELKKVSDAAVDMFLARYQA